MLFNPDDRILFRRVWQLAWPTALYGALELAVGVVDLLMVRPFGPTATAAIGMGRQVTFLVEVSALAITTGVITLLSQAIGAGATARAENVVRQAYRLVLLIGVPAALLGVVASRPLLVVMQADPTTVEQGAPYLQTYFLGLVFLWANLIGAAVFRASGNMHTPLKIALGVNVLNVLFNYVFIYGLGPVPAFDVQGAAIGTVLARTFSASLFVLMLWRGSAAVRLRWRMPPADSVAAVTSEIDDDGTNLTDVAVETSTVARALGFDGSMIRRMLKVGMPIAISGMVRNASRLFFLGIVGLSASRVAYHAAVGIGLQIRLVSVVPAIAFQIAIATLVGQAIGRGDLDEAELIGRRGILLLATLMLGPSLVVLVLAEPLAMLFVDSAATAQLGATVLRWFAVGQFFSAVSIGTQGALVGAGDTAPTMRYTVLSQWIVMLPLAYFLLVPLEMDPAGPLLAWTVAPILALGLMQGRLRSGAWRTLRA